jgi:hypothetical protein
LSPDPLVQFPTFSQSWNRYSYVNNTPTSFTDPTGYTIEEIEVRGSMPSSSSSFNFSAFQTFGSIGVSNGGGIGSGGGLAAGGFGEGATAASETEMAEAEESYIDEIIVTAKKTANRIRSIQAASLNVFNHPTPYAAWITEEWHFFGPNTYESTRPSQQPADTEPLILPDDAVAWVFRPGERRFPNEQLTPLGPTNRQYAVTQKFGLIGFFVTPDNDIRMFRQYSVGSEVMRTCVTVQGTGTAGCE